VCMSLSIQVMPREGRKFPEKFGDREEF